MVNVTKGNQTDMADNMTTTQFDPGEHTIAEVADHLEANPDDRDRILAAETAGKARKGVLESGDEPAPASTGPVDYLGRAIVDGKDYLGRTAT